MSENRPGERCSRLTLVTSSTDSRRLSKTHCLASLNSAWQSTCNTCAERSQSVRFARRSMLLWRIVACEFRPHLLRFGDVVGRTFEGRSQRRQHATGQKNMCKNRGSSLTSGKDVMPPQMRETRFLTAARGIPTAKVGCTLCMSNTLVTRGSGFLFTTGSRNFRRRDYRLLGRVRQRRPKPAVPWSLRRC